MRTFLHTDLSSTCLGFLLRRQVLAFLHGPYLEGNKVRNPIVSKLRYMP